MSNSRTRRLADHKRRIQYRLRQREQEPQDRPMFTARSIHYELADRARGLSAGRIEALSRRASPDTKSLSACLIGVVDAPDLR